MVRRLTRTIVQALGRRGRTCVTASGMRQWCIRTAVTVRVVSKRSADRSMIRSCMPLVSRASNRRLFMSTDIGRIEPARPATHRNCGYGRGLPGECTSTWRLLNTGSAGDLGRSYSRPASQSGARAPGVRDFAALASAPPYAPVNIVVADRRSARGGPRGRAVTTALADSPARAGRMSSFRTYLGRKIGDTNRPAPEHFPPTLARGTCRAGPPAPSGPFLRTLAGWLIGSSLARR